MSPNRLLGRLLPFLRWFPLSSQSLRADLLAGLTVGLVLVPQSMAYAQLAGLPAYYGLYAACIPVLIGALWGSSNQLATGPVAMVSILAGASLAQFAAPGSDRFIALAIALALLVGLMQLALGVLRLGAIVSFLSHPVVIGFTNAAAIIIALSQLDKLLGVSMGRSDHFLRDVWGVLEQAGEVHLPTAAMGLGALLVIVLLRRFAPKVPAVLTAVVLATLLSWLTGYERSTEIALDEVGDADARVLASEHLRGESEIARLNREIDARAAELREMEASASPNRQHALTLDYQVRALRLELRAQENENRLRARALRRFVLLEHTADGKRVFRAASPAAAPEAPAWRIQRISGDRLLLVGGGQVVGRIPAGLPALALPRLSLETLAMLFSTAVVITLVGFMEAISIAKAIAARTRQRIDPNQELIGQGLANIVGSFAQSYPVSGSFSRTAVNVDAGARTGLASAVSALVVLVTLLFLTPLLYHLPQAVLAAIILVAVSALVDLRAMRHVWRASRDDGICALATFVATLAFAPHLDSGILLGAGLAIVMFLYRTMSPRVTIRFHGADAEAGAEADTLVAIRFDGRLYFANVPYFEDAILEAVAAHPSARAVLVVGSGINEIDASGEDMLRHLHRRMGASGIRFVFADMKPQVLSVLQATGLYETIGAHAFFASERDVLEALRDRGEIASGAAATGSASS